MKALFIVGLWCVCIHPLAATACTHISPSDSILLQLTANFSLLKGQLNRFDTVRYTKMSPEVQAKDREFMQVVIITICEVSLQYTDAWVYMRGYEEACDRMEEVDKLLIRCAEIQAFLSLEISELPGTQRILADQITLNCQSHL